MSLMVHVSRPVTGSSTGCGTVVDGVVVMTVVVGAVFLSLLRVSR